MLQVDMSLKDILELDYDTARDVLYLFLMTVRPIYTGKIPLSHDLWEPCLADFELKIVTND